MDSKAGSHGLRKRAHRTGHGLVVERYLVGLRVFGRAHLARGAAEKHACMRYRAARWMVQTFLADSAVTLFQAGHLLPVQDAFLFLNV